MARKTVRTEIPRSKPEDLLSLGDRIVEKHLELGAESPLKDANIVQLTASLTDAKGKRKESKKLKETSEKLMEASNVSLGTHKGQTSDTPGTALFHIVGCRDALLSHFRGNEEALSEFGFKVVVDSKGAGGPKKGSA